MQISIDNKSLELVRGDITEQQVDVIVNAANSRLAGGGGVDGAIHRRGGPAIMEETNRRYPDGCPTGSAVISGAGSLPARFVAHAVGPVWHGGGHGEAKKLATAYRCCLELAAENACQSIAFPAISCGVYGYPIEQAAKIALGTTIDFLGANDAPALARFVLFGNDTFDLFEIELKRIVME
jgi:O-acetyl-ADP-ribose deacetylase (regulator of RNase III)